MVPGRGTCSSDTSVCRRVITERPALVTEGLMSAESWPWDGGVGACELEGSRRMEGGREGGRGIKCGQVTCPEPALPPSPGQGRGWQGGSSLSRNLFDQREHVLDGVERQRGPGVSPGAVWGTPRITLPEVSPAGCAFSPPQPRALPPKPVVRQQQIRTHVRARGGFLLTHGGHLSCLCLHLLVGRELYLFIFSIFIRV